MITFSPICSVGDLDNATKGTGQIFKAIDISSNDIAANGLTADGILQPEGMTKAGGHGTIAVMGFSKYTAAAAITKGTNLTVVASGYMNLVTSGSRIVGQAWETVSSGSVGEGFFNFAVKPFAVNCLTV